MALVGTLWACRRLWAPGRGSWWQRKASKSQGRSSCCTDEMGGLWELVGWGIGAGAGTPRSCTRPPPSPFF